ncbi:hypothetical protein AB0K16_44510 [Nonomuraea jabiensis]|uniref:hypothetical protein n=1 Tax=Nonomuraea jabiensis TaxID=882448 RepID=UPI003426C313
MAGHNPQDLRPLLDAFKARHPACDPHIRSIDFGDPFATLRNGEIDIAPIWPPVNEPVITGGEAMSPVHLHAARCMTRSDTAYGPIHDAPLARWALIWRAAAETDLVRALAHTAGNITISLP